LQPHVSVSSSILEGLHLLVGMSSGDIVTSRASQFAPTGLHGDDFAVAPDGETLAYVHKQQLSIYVRGREATVRISGQIRMPAWNADSTYLAFILHQVSGDSVYRVSRSTLEPERLLTIPEVVAPPLSGPATGRLLIVERLGEQRTAFYTIDPDCRSLLSCEKSRQDIATVSYGVNWADYHPNAASIVFSTGDNPNLFLLMAGIGKVQTLLADDNAKRRPMFSPDGNWLAYINVSNSDKIYLLRLKDGRVYPLDLLNVKSVAWSGKSFDEVH
jgi:Tol biopolymer transport system component